MLRILWTAKRSNTSILAEIKEEMSLVHKVLKLKLTYFGNVVRSDGLEKEFMIGMGNGRRGMIGYGVERSITLIEFNAGSIEKLNP